MIQEMGENQHEPTERRQPGNQGREPGRRGGGLFNEFRSSHQWLGDG